MVEGGQASLVGLAPVQNDIYAQTHELSYKCTSITNKGDNLDRYRLEMNGTTETTRALAGEVLAASINDVIGEVLNLVTRSEVGLLDVAWSIQESETEEIRRLDRNRARDLREIERNLEQGLGELE